MGLKGFKRGLFSYVHLISYLQPPIVPRIRHTGDTRNFFEYPEQDLQSWYHNPNNEVLSSACTSLLFPAVRPVDRL
jgi:hypothetical protein